MERSLIEKAKKLAELVMSKFWAKEAPALLQAKFEEIPKAIEPLKQEINEAMQEIVDVYDASAPLGTAIKDFGELMFELGSKFMVQLAEDEKTSANLRELKQESLEEREFIQNCFDELQ